MTIHERVADWAERGPEASAVLAPGRQPLSYGRLYAHVLETVAALNALGLGRGDRVAVALPDGPEAVVAVLAVASGTTAVLLNPASSAAELAPLLAQCGAAALLSALDAAPSPAEAARKCGIPAIELAPASTGEAGLFRLRGESGGRAACPGLAKSDDLALVLPTSGTTARPKIVPLSQADVCAHAQRVRSYLDLTPGDRCLNFMSAFHSGGIMPMLATLFAGASGVYPPAVLVPELFGWIEEYRPTWCAAAPPAYAMILTEAQRASAIASRAPMRLLFTCGASLPPGAVAALEEALHAPLQNSYGATECGGITLSPMPPRPRKQGSVGVTVELEIAVMDGDGRALPAGEPGEVVVRGRGVFRGYENDSEANAAAFRDGWYRTGDQGYLDQDSYLFLTGRLKELINRGGEKIAPQEVEEVLLHHPSVADAAVFAIPHSQLGEDLAAAVVSRGNVAREEGEIRDFVGRHLADFKIPRSIMFVPEIPRSAAGKVQRARLAEEFAAECARTPPPPSGPATPRTPIERKLAAIWIELLGLPSVDPDDDFFDLGGHSLTATRLAARVWEEFGRKLPVDALFQAPTIRRLAAVLEDGGATATSRIVPIKPEGSRPPFFMLRPRPMFRLLAKQLGPDQPFLGLALPEREQLPRRYQVEDLARDLVGVLRQRQPSGPYSLGGWCADGLVAYEMAQQLQAQGQRVALLALFDAINPACLNRRDARLRPRRGLLERWFRTAVRVARFHVANMRQLRTREMPGYIGQRVAVLWAWTEARAARVFGESVASSEDYPGQARLRIDVWVPMRSYRPKPYPGRVVLFRAADWHPPNCDEPSFGWRDAVGDGLTVHEVPGDHLSMFLEPHVNTVAGKLAAQLEETAVAESR